MATKDYVHYKDNAAFAGSWINKVRVLDFYVDFTDEDNQVAAAADSLQLFEIPAGYTIIAAGQEQMVAGSAGSTTTVRVGTVAYTGTLASDAAVGTNAAHADVSGGHPGVLAAAADFNLLVGTDVRATGAVRAWVVLTETKRPGGHATLAARDQSTGLA
jgi:hypothetical protein